MSSAEWQPSTCAHYNCRIGGKAGGVFLAVALCHLERQAGVALLADTRGVYLADMQPAITRGLISYLGNTRVMN
jgi:hypothetical protein